MNRKQWYAFAIAFYLVGFVFLWLAALGSSYNVTANEALYLASQMKSNIAGIFLGLATAFTLVATFEKED